MLLKLVLIVAGTYTATALSGDNVLNLPTQSELTNIAAWSANELKLKLNKLFCDDPDPAVCTSFANFFPEKGTVNNPNNPPFVLKQPGENPNTPETYSLNQFKEIVKAVKDTIGSLGVISVECSNPTICLVNGADCDPFSGLSPQEDDIFKITSDQNVQIDGAKFFNNVPQNWPTSLTVSAQVVTYEFKWKSNGDKNVLISIDMKDKEGSDHVVANLITHLNGGRRRLMKRDSVKYVMQMPKVISVPLISGVVVLFIAVTAVLIWKSLCFFFCCTADKKKENLNDVCAV